MSIDAEEYVARVLDEEPLPVVAGSSDSSKWAAVHDALEPPAVRSTANNGPGSLFTVAWILGITLGLIWVLRNGRTVFEQWQENVHRRANRSRHGIPDDDDRPFNVAYAAAALARREREEQGRKRSEGARRVAPRPVSEQANHKESVGLRQRSFQPAGPIPTPFEDTQPAFLQGPSTRPLGNNVSQFGPGENSTHRVQFRPPLSTDPRVVQSYDWSDRHSANGPADLPQASQRSSSGDRNSRRHLEVDDIEPTSAERRKFHEMDGANNEDRSTKKSRVAVEEHIDGDNDAAWANMPGGSRRGSLQVLKRGSKRHANEEADDDWEMSKDKRARKTSGPKTSEEDNFSDVDMAHEESGDEAGPSRGTKRVRDDAESVADSAPQSAEVSPSRKPAHKRRVRRKSESEPTRGAPSRGRKRDRSQERTTSSGGEDEEDDKSAPRHKKGRRGEEHEDEDSDIVPDDAAESESEAEISSDPACGGRRVGETWEVNGQNFKVGLDGRRLRHALVKQSRNKFPMPKDSTHRDSKTNVEVIVEKWLNDEEYKAAKERFELAWQDVSPVSTPEKTPGSARWDEPPSGGKRLLWDGPPPSPVKGRASMHATPGVQNPFDLAPSNSGRRIASAQILLNNKIESPKLRNSKSFSKWEKQDLEANSLKKMRARMEKQKAEAAAAVAAKSSTPAIAPTPLAATTNTQSQPPLPNLNLPKPTTPQSNTLPAANPFAKPEGSTPAGFSANSFAKPASSTPTAPSANPFAKPGSTTPASSIPNFFDKPAITPSGGGAQPSGALALGTSSTSSSAPTAQTATKPSVALGAGSGQPTTQKPSFTFGQPGATPSSFTPNASPAASKPFSFPPPSEAKRNDAPSSEPGKSGIPNFFAKPASQAAGSTPSSEPGKSGVPSFFSQPASQPAGSNPSSEPGKNGMPNFFVKSSQNPAPGTASASTAPGTGAFHFPGAQTTQSNPPAKSAFQFGQPGGQTSTSPPKGNFQFGRPGGQNDTPPTKSNFQFGQPGGQNASNTPPPSGTTSSLLNRLAPPQSSSEPNAPQNAFSSPLTGGQTASSPSLFGNSAFGPFSSNSSGQSQSQPSRANPSGQTQGQGQQANTNKPPLFGTGATVTSEPAKGSAFSAPSSTPFAFSKPSGQTGANAQPAASVFSFGSAQPGQQQQPTAPKPSYSFNFGGTSTPANSAQPPAAQPGATNTNTSAPPPSSFNPAAAAAAPSTGQFTFDFGGTPKTSSPSGNPFGGFGAKPADSEKK